MIALINLENLSVSFTTNAALASSTDLYVASTEEDLKELTGPLAVALYNTTAKELDNGLAEVTRFADKKSMCRRLWANLVDLEAKRAEEASKAHLDEMPLVLAKNYEPSEDFKKRHAVVNTGPAKDTDYPAPAPKVRRSQGINLTPKAKVYPCREGSKQAILVDMLSRSGGATMEELIRALEHGKAWKEVTVKSGLNWDMNKVKGYGIRTTFRNAFESWLECDYESMGSFEIPAGFDGHPDDNDDARKQAILDYNIKNNGFDPNVRNISVYHLVLPAGMTAPLAHTPRKAKKED